MLGRLSSREITAAGGLVGCDGASSGVDQSRSATAHSADAGAERAERHRISGEAARCRQRIRATDHTRIEWARSKVDRLQLWIGDAEILAKSYVKRAHYKLISLASGKLDGQPAYFAYSEPPDKPEWGACFIVFVAILGWTFARSRRGSFEQAAQIPFTDD